MSEDTIIAIATPPGKGGVGILRLSGSKAYSIALQLSKKEKITPRLATYCSIVNSDQELIDQAIILYFKGPHSFTGEDVIEIQGHGSPVILDMITQEALRLGARMARPGEFSERAFLNDKMDLTQAEAIADLINSNSQTAARMAIRSLQGDFSAKIHQLNEELIYLRLYVEASIDFPEEEIDFLNDGKVARLLQSILDTLHTIRSQATQGVLFREGLSLVIAGRPNAGKSTLINCLAGRDVAIVTDIAGTTRDVMREHILLDDIPLHIIDTAGLRDSDDVVEKEGIKRAWQELKQADCVLLVVDVNDPDSHQDVSEEIKAALPEHVPVITVFNKMDTVPTPPQTTELGVCISAKAGLGIDALKGAIKKAVGFQNEEGQFLARRRHLHALDEAKKLLLAGQKQLQEHRAGELLAEDLRLAHEVLCQITGEFTSDDLLGAIFSSFCIGK